jgi:lipid-binding SYLF domain-containing protein
MRALKLAFIPLVAALGMPLVGCESTNTTTGNLPHENATLDSRARATVDQMTASDPGLRDVLQNGYGYVIFPEVGKAAVGIGGAGGKGVVYQQGQKIGYATLNQGSVGVQLGGETYAELIVFKTPDALAVFKNGNLTFGADASATLVKAGAAAAGQFNNGTRIFILPKGGLMAGVSIMGQKFGFSASEGNNNM